MLYSFFTKLNILQCFSILWFQNETINIIFYNMLYFVSITTNFCISIYIDKKLSLNLSFFSLFFKCFVIFWQRKAKLNHNYIQLNQFLKKSQHLVLTEISFSPLYHKLFHPPHTYVSVLTKSVCWLSSKDRYKGF